MSPQLSSAMMSRSLKQGTPQIKRQDGYYGDAGMFGGPATLPSGAGPVDPPILTGGGGNYPSVGPVQAGDLRTRLDPNMGQIPPSIQISGGGPNSSRNPGTFAGGGISFSQSGQLRGGVNGPQGSVYGIDPNTGNPIYNVTGSPAPGFFDSKTGKIVEGLGSVAGNMLFPGAGSAAKWILDAFRRNQAKNNTGTDLSGNNTASQPAAAAQPASGPAWFQPGYQPPAGIQAAIARGDYSTAYGPSASSLSSLKIMNDQAQGGAPNLSQPDQIGYMGEDPVEDPLNFNPGSMKMTPGYLQTEANKGGPRIDYRALSNRNAYAAAMAKFRNLNPLPPSVLPAVPPLTIQPARGG